MLTGQRMNGKGSNRYEDPIDQVSRPGRVTKLNNNSDGSPDGAARTGTVDVVGVNVNIEMLFRPTMKIVIAILAIVHSLWRMLACPVYACARARVCVCTYTCMNTRIQPATLRSEAFESLRERSATINGDRRDERGRCRRRRRCQKEIHGRHLPTNPRDIGVFRKRSHPNRFPGSYDLVSSGSMKHQLFHRPPGDGETTEFWIRWCPGICALVLPPASLKSVKRCTPQFENSSKKCEISPTTRRRLKPPTRPSYHGWYFEGPPKRVIQYGYVPLTPIHESVGGVSRRGGRARSQEFPSVRNVGVFVTKVFFISRNGTE
ncbi:hypothetical protein EVAR_14448_1 [Eumeta japonica]|uniref:Uncharacterized protein n=1 Tax=Eumeta variegata TaxID=151549 RepID=A0A4C1U2W9_EUMVA|nr:hypothetical protein EVAR_14448_1 [Eumeta japonica]